MRYSRIKHNDIANADGISVSLYLQGCPHCCKGCFNRETWDYEGGKVFDESTMEKILHLLVRDGVKRNLSILGGEPLLERNLKMLEELCKRARKQNPKIKIWLWTGYEYEDVMNLAIVSELDYIIDGKYIEELKELDRYKGSSNQRLIKLKTIN